MSDKLLAGNLIEISHATNSKDLVAFRSKIYHGSYGFGRIIKWLLDTFPFLGSKEIMLKKASDRTRDLFFRKIKQLGRAKQHLEKEVKRRIVGKEISGAYFKNAQDMLNSFCCYFDPFIKDIRKERATKAFAFLTAGVSDNNAREIAAIIRDFFEELRFYQKIFQFEQVTKFEIPFDLVRKMSLDLRLNVREKKRIHKWIEQLNKSANWTIPSFDGDVANTYVQTRSMHRLLCRIVEFTNEKLPKQDDDFDVEVEALEANLIDLGYNIFDQPDYKHIAWRKSLEEGEIIDWNGKALELGEVLYNSNKDPYEPVIFSVVNEPALEVAVYHNESWSYSKRFQESILHCGIKGRKILGLSEFGRIVIQERLYDSLADIDWEATKKTGITENDVENAKPIVALVRGLKTRPFTPIVGEDNGIEIVGRLYPEHFAFTNEDKLRAAECLVPGHFSFDTLENFVFECANNNSLVFSHIMRATRLGDLPAAKQYQQLFLDALQEKDEYISITRNSSIIDKALIEKRKDFYDNTRNLFEQCLKVNKAIYKINNYSVFKKLLIKELVKIQKTKSPGSVLDPYLFAEAIFNTLMITRPMLEKQDFDKRVKQIIRSKDKRFLNAKDNDLYEDWGIFNSKQISQARKRIIKAMK